MIAFDYELLHLCFPGQVCEGWEYISETLLMAEEVETCDIGACVANCEEPQRRPPGKQNHLC